MLQPVMHKLASQRLVLASGSPRRRLLLNNIGLNCEVVPSNYEENLDKRSFSHPRDYVLATAMNKVKEVAQRLCQDQRPPDLLIGADTVVTMDEQIFEKPLDKEHAFQMLMGFSGRNHTVITGVVLLTPKVGIKNNFLPMEDCFNIIQFYEATDVWFAKVSQEIVRSYIETGEPMDKAGGYGIQGAGGTLIEKIDGDYFNVMGFPLHQFAKHVLEMYTYDHVSCDMFT